MAMKKVNWKMVGGIGALVVALFLVFKVFLWLFGGGGDKSATTATSTDPVAAVAAATTETIDRLRTEVEDLRKKNSELLTKLAEAEAKVSASSTVMASLTDRENRVRNREDYVSTAEEELKEKKDQFDKDVISAKELEKDKKLLEKDIAEWEKRKESISAKLAEMEMEVGKVIADFYASKSPMDQERALREALRVRGDARNFRSGWSRVFTPLPQPAPVINGVPGIEPTRK